MLLVCCHSDSGGEARGNPLVAGDEDIESEEEVSATPSLGLAHTLSEEKSPRRGSARLKAVKDVELTESESDTDHAVPDPANQGSQATKIKMSGEFAFDEPLIPSVATPLPVAVPEPGKPKGTGVGGGLLLSFGPSQQQPVEVEEEVQKKEKERVKRKKKGKRAVRGEEGPPQASETLDLDSWLGDDGQGATVSKVSAATRPLSQGFTLAVGGVEGAVHLSDLAALWCGFPSHYLS